MGKLLKVSVWHLLDQALELPQPSFVCVPRLGKAGHENWDASLAVVVNFVAMAGPQELRLVFEFSRWV